MIADVSLKGRISETYHSLSPADQTDFLAAAVEAVHLNPFGACITLVVR
jgi:hypothetical protein